jgi:hypothetical protein
MGSFGVERLMRSGAWQLQHSNWRVSWQPGAQQTGGGSAPAMGRGDGAGESLGEGMGGEARGEALVEWLQGYIVKRLTGYMVA